MEHQTKCLEDPDPFPTPPPSLSGIACLCCDARRQVRMQALTYLQRALLVHDLQKLDALEWESCFNKVGLLTALKRKFGSQGRKSEKT